MNTPLKIASIALFLLWSGAASNAQTDGTFKLKHHSSFTNAPARNPFWPIGWVKGDTTKTETQEAEVPITADKFEVTSISTGSAPLAMINGKTYAEGETINAVYGDQKIKILVVAINDGAVVLQYLDKKYTIPLKRPELVHNPVSNDDDLLPRKDDNTLILH
jgi:hypothetical protein